MHVAEFGDGQKGGYRFRAEYIELPPEPRHIGIYVGLNGFDSGKDRIESVDAEQRTKTAHPIYETMDGRKSEAQNPAPAHGEERVMEADTLPPLYFIGD